MIQLCVQQSEPWSAIHTCAVRQGKPASRAQVAGVRLAIESQPSATHLDVKDCLFVNSLGAAS